MFCATFWNLPKMSSFHKFQWTRVMLFMSFHGPCFEDIYLKKSQVIQSDTDGNNTSSCLKRKQSSLTFSGHRVHLLQWRSGSAAPCRRQPDNQTSALLTSCPRLQHTQTQEKQLEICFLLESKLSLEHASNTLATTRNQKAKHSQIEHIIICMATETTHISA